MEKVKVLTFTNKKIYFYATVIVFICIALWGYAFDTDEEPNRVAFATRGGGVIFNHTAHTIDYEIDCADCHHNYDINAVKHDQMSCRSCHYDRTNQAVCAEANIHKRCIGENCTSCHVSGSVGCNFCHNDKNFTPPVEPETIEYDTDAGLVEFDHYIHASPDEFDLGCEACHHGYEEELAGTYPMSCRRCHDNTEYESICEDADIHSSCIGANCIECHTDGGDDCEICHEQ